MSSISTAKLKTVNFSDKALDENKDSAVDIAEIRDFASNLSKLIDSIQ
jgi:hypothetical protein